MPRKVQTAQRPYTLLVANLRSGSDPSRNSGGNPVKVRTGFEFQHFPEINRDSANDRGPNVENPRTPGVATRVGRVDYTTPPVPVNSGATITVADNNFAVPASILLGEFVLTSNEHFTPGGSTALTATALAAAIDALPGFGASAALSDVTVVGPAGPNGNAVLFEALYTGTVQNFTLSTTTGHLAGGEPTIGPPVIL